MKPIIWAGIILVLLSMLALSHQSINYAHPEKRLYLGKIPMSEGTQGAIPLPPLQLGIAMIGGIVLLLADTKRRKKKLDK